MAFCAWCGNPVAAVSYAACPSCGNPANGAQRVVRNDGAKAAGLVIGLIVAGLVLVAFLGILAAIAIPNFLTAKQRAMQKRTMSDMRDVSVALQSFAADEGGGSYPHGTSVGQLSPNIEPDHGKNLPRVDAWGTPFLYECWPSDECTSFALASAGKDRSFQHSSLQEYPTGMTTTFEDDIVLVDGKFVQYPEGAQQ